MTRRIKRSTAKPRRRRTSKQASEPVKPKQAPEPQPSNLPEDEVVEASMESFPASDAPSWSQRGSDSRAEERE